MAINTIPGNQARNRMKAMPALRFAEVLICVAVLIALTLLLARIRIAQSYEARSGDTLLFEQIVENIAHGRGAVSSLFASTQKLIDSGALSMTRDDYLRVVAEFDPDAPRNMLKFHAYFVLYILSWFCRFWKAQSILAYAQVLSFTLLAGEVYAWLRYRKVSIVGALAFTCLVASHPAWGVSIDGQFYPDRLFLPLGFASFVAIHDRWKMWWALPVVLLTLSVNERAATVLGLFLIAHAICFVTRANLRASLLKILLGIGLLGLGSYIQSHILENLYYGSFMPGSLGDLTARFSNPAFRDALLTFVMVNAGLFLLALFNWRASLIVAGLLVPNMLGSVGGAEKTVFLTHYHSYYFPALIWAAGLGFASLTAKLPTLNVHRHLQPVLVPMASVLLCAFVLLAHLVDWNKPGRVALSWENFANTNALMSLPRSSQMAFGAEGQGIRRARNEAIALVPPGSRVSAQQSAMWAAGGRAEIFIYPFGMEAATDLLVTCHAEPDGGWTWNAVESFRPAADQQLIETGFRDRARSLGFDVDHPICSSPPFQVGLIARVMAPP